MKKDIAIQFKLAIKSYQTKMSLKAFAKKEGVARQTLYNWRERLEAAAPLVFGYGRFPKGDERAKQTIERLNDRVAELELLLSTHGIEIPPPQPKKPHRGRIRKIKETKGDIEAEAEAEADAEAELSFYEEGKKAYEKNPYQDSEN